MVVNKDARNTSSTKRKHPCHPQQLQPIRPLLTLSPTLSYPLFPYLAYPSPSYIQTCPSSLALNSLSLPLHLAGVLAYQIMLPPPNIERGAEGRPGAVVQPWVEGSWSLDRLNVIAKDDLCQQQLELVVGEVSTRAAGCQHYST